MSPYPPGSLGIDLGKTSCRVRLYSSSGVLRGRSSGVEGFAKGSENVTTALRAVREALAGIPAEELARVRHIAIGAAGVEAGRDAAAQFAHQLAHEYCADVMLITDALAAHAGALGGGDGTVLIVGTGAVAFHLDRGGELTRADGWGIWLGDMGSGRWIGQEGLRRVLQAQDGTGRETSLRERALAVTDSLDSLPRYVADGEHPERRLASFAPSVIEEAAAGDEVAAAIMREAIGHLVRAVTACTAPGDHIALVGGLTSSEHFLESLTHALHDHDLNPVAAIGDAIAGALLISAETKTPHERFALRVHSRRS